MPDIDPGDIGRRSFRTAFRGYDTDEVRSFLASVSETMQTLLAQRDELVARLEAGGAKDLEAEFAAVSREVGEVLEAARSAAEGMRERAAAEAARWRSEAVAEAERTRKDALADAQQLRGDAWTTAEELLKQCQREATRILDEAREESLRLVGESERQAHRIQGSARREADEVLRAARMEAERLVVDAQTRHDEIIEGAHRQAEVAQERTRALESRRDELRKELDAVRAALSKAEGELDERRELLGLSQPEPVKDVPPEDERIWAPGETVRVVKPQRPGNGPADAPPPSEVPPQEVEREIGGEIRIITASELARVEETSREEPPANRSEELDVDEIIGDRGAPSPGVPTEAEEPPPSGSVGAAPAERSPADTPEPPTDAAAGPEPERRPDDVFGLFARLRTAREERKAAAAEHEEADAEPAGTAPVAEPAEVAGEEASPLPPGADTPSPPAADGEAGVDPFDLRDRLLLPIANRALRDLKRTLTEQQNAALEEIRLHDAAWHPDVAAYAGAMRGELQTLVAESFGAGRTAAVELAGTELPHPELPDADPAGDVADELARDLEHVLSEGRAHDEGARALSATVSRVFRAWRTDESERRVRDLSLDAYHHGLIASAEAGGLGSHRWIVSGRGCATCRAAAEEASSDRLPPVHPGCGCTVVPAES